MEYKDIKHSVQAGYAALDIESICDLNMWLETNLKVALKNKPPKKPTGSLSSGYPGILYTLYRTGRFAKTVKRFDGVMQVNIIDGAENDLPSTISVNKNLIKYILKVDKEMPSKNRYSFLNGEFGVVWLRYMLLHEDQDWAIINQIMTEALALKGWDYSLLNGLAGTMMGLIEACAEFDRIYKASIFLQLKEYFEEKSIKTKNWIAELYSIIVRAGGAYARSSGNDRYKLNMIWFTDNILYYGNLKGMTGILNSLVLGGEVLANCPEESPEGHIILAAEVRSTFMQQQYEVKKVIASLFARNAEFCVDGKYVTSFGKVSEEGKDFDNNFSWKKEADTLDQGLVDNDNEGANNLYSRSLFNFNNGTPGVLLFWLNVFKHFPLPEEKKPEIDPETGEVPQKITKKDDKTDGLNKTALHNMIAFITKEFYCRHAFSKIGKIINLGNGMAGNLLIFWILCKNIKLEGSAEDAIKTLTCHLIEKVQEMRADKTEDKKLNQLYGSESLYYGSSGLLFLLSIRESIEYHQFTTAKESIEATLLKSLKIEEDQAPKKLQSRTNKLARCGKYSIKHATLGLEHRVVTLSKTYELSFPFFHKGSEIELCNGACDKIAYANKMKHDVPQTYDVETIKLPFKERQVEKMKSIFGIGKIKAPKKEKTPKTKKKSSAETDLCNLSFDEGKDESKKDDDTKEDDKSCIEDEEGKESKAHSYYSYESISAKEFSGSSVSHETKTNDQTNDQTNVSETSQTNDQTSETNQESDQEHESSDSDQEHENSDSDDQEHENKSSHT